MFGFVLIRVHPKIWKCIQFPPVVWDLVVVKEQDGEGNGEGWLSEHNQVSVKEKNWKRPNR